MRTLGGRRHSIRLSASPVRVWSARRHETGHNGTRQCLAETVPAYRFLRVAAGQRKKPGRFPKPGVGSSILPKGAAEFHRDSWVVPTWLSRRFLSAVCPRGAAIRYVSERDNANPQPL